MIERYFFVLLTFVLGYTAIAFEHGIRLEKAATALLTGVLCWTLYAIGSHDQTGAAHLLTEQLGEIAGILFFLLGSMVVVELIDAHDGFQIITDRIRTTDGRRLLWAVALFTFFLSSVLANMTTTIVMVSLLRKLVAEREKRLLFCGIVVIAANAGGAWSPLGDVTTTMLWIGKQVTAGNIILKLLLPSIVCLLVPTAIMARILRGRLKPPVLESRVSEFPARERNLVLFTGLAAMLFVPVFSAATGLPPFMAMLFGVAILWIVTELLHKKKPAEERGPLTVAAALQRIDTPSILFFLGILLSVAALQSAGLLVAAAQFLTEKIPSQTVVVMLLGLLSAIVDNVPLVAASQAMFPLSQYPTDHFFWEFLAYATGVGGSCLVIGSAAGVAAMGMEGIGFVWYVRRVAGPALLGFLAGAAVHVALS